MSSLLCAYINHIRIKHITLSQLWYSSFCPFKKQQQKNMLITIRYVKYYIRLLSNIKINVISVSSLKMVILAFHILEVMKCTYIDFIYGKHKCVNNYKPTVSGKLSD